MNKNIVGLLDDLMNPPKEFTPIPFWFFNDEPDLEKIKMQLTDYVEKGVNGIVLHPRIGIPKTLEYLSDEYFEIVKFIVKTAAELEMLVVLYDEGMYPSGSAHGEVVKANPDFASVGIIMTDDPTSGKLIVDLEDGNYIVQRFTKGTIRGIHFGEDDGQPGAPPSTNILNPLAVDKFIELTHERYYQHLKEYFGNTIIGFFTDEPCILGRNASRYRDWTDNLEEDIVASGGELKELRALFEKKENRTTKIYKSLIKNRLMEVFYGKISKWCEEHGIALMGHPEASDDIAEELYFHIPGQDLIFRRVSPEEGGIIQSDSVHAKTASDIARHLGRRRNSNECFGVCIRNKTPWYFTGEDMKWYIDWLGVRGVNMYIPHAFFYSVKGERSGERPPDVGPNNIWWDHYKHYSDYMKRISYIMTDSNNNANIAVLCHDNQVPYKELVSLFEQQIEFNYLPLALLEQCSIKDNKLCINGYEYDTVVNVIGAEGYDILKSVHTVTDCNDIQKQDFITKDLCKNLRVSHITKDNIEMYFVFNEGQEDVDTQATVPLKGEIIAVDLWKGKSYKLRSSSHEEKTQFPLQLKAFETVLIIIGDAGELEEKPEVTFLGNLTETFKCVKDENNQKLYTANLQVDKVEGNEVFEVVGEEMVECYCNGEFVGVSFWNNHSFSIGKWLQTGDNEIKLRVTGNIANIYTNEKIPYGLGIYNK